MRRISALAATLVLSATACIGGGDSARTVLVDFSHDEFASAFIRFFPGEIDARQGDEIVFRQTWTGEPHTVTGGTLANELMEAVEPYREKFYNGRAIPPEAPEDIAKLEEKVVWAFGEGDELNQTGSQPCYLNRGEPRKDGKPCRTQEQPEFTGRQTFYNSGIIPYEGQQGNEYRVKLADNIKPGAYWFYCIVHGEFQSTKVNVKASDAEVPSPDEIRREARVEIDRLADPLLKQFRDARDGTVRLPDPRLKRTHRLSGNFAGMYKPSVNFPDTSINEFIPRRFTVDAGEKITWNLMGHHTISFGVPRYFPIIEFQSNGNVRFNPKLDPPAGGAKRFDVPEEERYGGSPEPIEFDGGTYDGTGFWSSGTMDADPYIEYSMRITKPGTYRYACLIHPPMVGTVEVT